MDEAVGRAELILHLRRQNVAGRQVLAAMERVPRSLFLRAAEQPLAHKDRALPIDCGQTISQPSVVAIMTEALALTGAERVLEIGTGSGYQAAVLSHLAGEVITVERFRTLADLAVERLTVLRAANVTIRVGDGAEGAPDAAPFDRILVTAAAERVPDALLAQLATPGILVAPVGPRDGVQALVKVEQRADGRAETTLADVRFVPLRRGVPAAL